MIEVEKCITDTAMPLDHIFGNIKLNRERDLLDITDTIWWRQDERIAIVGGGPSLEKNIEKLKEYEYIIVCGSAHDYLWEQGIKATWCVIVDPDPITLEYIKHADGATTYLVATQCAPEVFEYLKDFNVYKWNADGDRVTDKAKIFGEGTKGIGGGCTVGTRAIVLAIGMGFYKQDLFGFDSCLTRDYKHHAYDFSDPDKETVGNIVEIKLGGPDSPTFKVAEYMLAQIFDFKNLLMAFAKKLDVKVYSDGPIAYLIELGKRGTL